MSAAVLACGMIFFGLTMFFHYSYTALLCILFLVHLLISVSPPPAGVDTKSARDTRADGGLSPVWQSIYSIVQQWNGKSVRSFTHDFKIDKDEVVNAKACRR